MALQITKQEHAIGRIYSIVHQAFGIFKREFLISLECIESAVFGFIVIFF